MKEMNLPIRENMYGHSKRLKWIISQLKESDSIVEFGCGTGYMITRPLSVMGYSATGIDLDSASIEYGREIFQLEGLDSDRLLNCDLSDLDLLPDVIIASEVLEHIPDEQLSDILQIIRSKTNPEGSLLVTVPNGYGWFELESFLWFKTGVGFLLSTLGVVRVLNLFKQTLLDRDIEPSYPASVADSPHVQRFTFQSIQALLKREGFEIVSIKGSVLFAGPFSNLFFTGIKPIMNLNCRLGDLFPKISAGFYCHCRLKKTDVSA